MDRRFFTSLLVGLAVILGLVALIVWVFETERTLGDLGAAFYWAITTVLGQGDASYVTVRWAGRWAGC
jgi:voltage-gated potassium channel